MNLDHVFVCGNPALDFAATLRARRSARSEMFVTPERLNAWYVESGIVDAVSPGQEADVERAKTVREAIYLLVTARRLGQGYDGTALTLVNDAARKPPAVPQLTPRADGRRRRRTKPSPWWRATPSSS
ncbi:hypothetical protein STAFG_2261 [Streptomyces afghaniensis 772]|uniref:Uncharacterized protein n=1 Tax=Streptomyces afghaniensis 772 TaxID=1283301 RepID=S4N1S2_9ACTN|nr:hypothetical protein STAFG_2261 [Streptomyces afghaniensis 772]